MERLRKEMPALRKQYNVRTLSVFGSYVRGKQTGRSDVDVVVQYDAVPDLIELVRLQTHLGTILGAKVDLVPRGALKGQIGQHILDEEVEV